MLQRLIWLTLLLAIWASASAGAAPRIVVVRDDTPVARQVADMLGREFSRLGWSSGELVVGDRLAADLRREEGAATVALGFAAVQATRQLGRPTVGALVTRAAMEESPLPPAERSTVIMLDQPVERWSALVRLAFADRFLVGLLAGPTLQRSIRTLERKFQERGLILVAETVNSGESIVPTLDRLLPRTRVLLALPDPLVHNRGTVQPLLLTTYRAGIPVVAYSEPYLNAGATISLYSTPKQVSEQIVESLQQLLDGHPAAAVQSPRYFTVGVNRAVARSLGLSLPSDGELQERLQAAD